jgi:polyphosphate kinase 2 (PPK2 family)
MILSSDTYLIKFYFSISKDEQASRFKDIKTSPLKKWKMTPVDERAQELWDDYTKYKEKMFERTHTDQSPWIIIDADKKTEARLSVMNYVLNKIPHREPNPEV